MRKWLSRFPNLLPRLSLVVALNLASGLLMILQAVLLAQLVTDVFLGGMHRADVRQPLIALLIVISLRALTFGLADWAAAKVSVRIREDLRTRLVRHLFQLGPVYLRTERSGELINTVMTGVEEIDVYISKYLPQAAHAFLIPVAVWCLVVGTDVWAAVILAVTAPLIPLFMILIGKGAQAVTKRQWQTLSVLGGHFLDVIRGLTTLKIFNRSRAQIEIIRHITDEYREATMRSLRIAFLSALVLELLTTLSTAIVAVMLGLRLLDGNIDFHRAFLILLLAPEFYQPIRMIGTQFHASMNGIEAATRIFSILDTKSPAAKSLALQPKPQGTVIDDAVDDAVGDSRDDPRVSELNLHAEERGQGTAYRNRFGEKTEDEAPLIEFEDVSFVYPGAQELVLQNVSFTVPVGKKVVLVGASGAGKSSIFDLLLGFARPSSGRIFVRGIDMNQMDIDAWRKQVAYVPQQTYLVPGTIRDNIRFSNPEETEQAVRHAARVADADDFIMRLPQQYETQITEKLRLSGGQAQRIAMARAILKNAPFVCLDEPTAQLDFASEYALQAGLDAALKGKTGLIVAHRLHTVTKADLIVVLQSGRVVETGTHSSLTDAGGMYARLWDAYTRKAECGVEQCVNGHTDLSHTDLSHADLTPEQEVGQ